MTYSLEITVLPGGGPCTEGQDCVEATRPVAAVQVREDGGVGRGRGQKWTEVGGFSTYFGGRTRRSLMHCMQSMKGREE